MNKTNLAFSKDWYILETRNGSRCILYDKQKNHSIILNKQGYIILDLLSCGNYSLSEIVDEACERLCINNTNNLSKVESFLKHLIDVGAIVEKNKKEFRNVRKIRKISTRKILSRLMVEVTQECNLNCQHCYLRWHNLRGKKNTLGYLELNSIIDQAEKMGVFEIELTGGEISLYPDIRKVLDRLSRSPMVFSVYSNLFFSNNELLKILCNSKPRYIVTSLDGFEEAHDKFRGIKGAFQITKSNIQKLKQMGASVLVNSIINKYSENDIPLFTKWLKNDLKVPYVLAGIISGHKDMEELSISEDKLADHIAKYSNSNDEIFPIRDPDKNFILPFCGVGYSMAFINALGEVSLCPTMTKFESQNFLAGNIHSSSIFDIWETSQVFNKDNNFGCEKINECNYSGKCGGGCRSRAFIQSKSAHSPDFVMCKVMEKTHKIL